MLWFLAQIKFFNVFLFSVIGRMIYIFYWHLKKKENFMRNKSTSPSIFIILGHQSSVTLNDLLDIKMDFFAANPNIVSCRPPRARRPIHCYHPNNVHHIHSSLLQSSCALLHYVVCSLHFGGPLICRALARLWPSVSCCDVFPQCWKQEEVQTRRQESQPRVEPDCHLQKHPPGAGMWSKACMGSFCIENLTKWC